MCVVCVLFIGVSFITDKISSPLTNAVAYVVMPIQKGMNYIGLWTNDKYDQLQEVSRLLEENESLHNTVDSLTEENNRLKQDTYELDRLRSLYELDAQYEDYPTISTALSAGEVDAFCVDKSILAIYNTDSRSYIEEEFAPQEYGIATTKGSGFSTVCEDLVQQWLSDGTIDGLITENGLD